MPQSNSLPTKPAAAELDAAFAALRSYAQGSSRGALTPIDDAVMASLDDQRARNELELRLVTALKDGGSAVAREFICSKLTLIGSSSCVPALIDQLAHAEFATAALNALEAIPGNQATEALRSSLAKTEGLQKIGVINSLGAKRDADSVKALSRLLQNKDAGIAGAAAAALGAIATTSAAKALKGFLAKAPASLQLQVADAILTCAERLLAAGKRTDARTLHELLATTKQPKHVQQAAARGLELASGGK